MQAVGCNMSVSPGCTLDLHIDSHTHKYYTVPTIRISQYNIPVYRPTLLAPLDVAK